MKKTLALLAFIILTSTVFPAAPKDTIRITNGEWEPYLSEYCYKYGLASHIVSESFKLEGIKIKWGFFPWARSYEIAKNGTWDASAVWWPTKKARRDFLISKPVVRTSFVFFHLKSRKFRWNSFNNLKGFRIGLTRGYDYGTAFTSSVKKNRIRYEFVKSDEQNLRKMLKDRIHIFPNDPIVGYSQIRNTFPPDKAKLFTHHPKKFAKTTLNLVVTKKGRNGKYFLKKFNSGFAKLKRSGKLAQMYRALNSGKYDKRKTKWRE